MRLGSRAATALLALALLPACTPQATAPSDRPVSAVPDGTPTPSHWCTPLPSPGATGEPVPCSPAQASWNAERLSVETEAIAVYERYDAEFEQVLRAGGAEELPPGLVETTHGRFQENLLTSIRSFRRNQVTMVGDPGPLKVAVNRRETQGSGIFLTVCNDDSNVTYRFADGRLGQGAQIHAKVFLDRVDGRLRIHRSQFVDVGTCPLG